MADLDMVWAGDLSVSPTGDILTVDGPSLGTERVLRRLLTNPGDYIWTPGYGAGLAEYIGQPAQAAALEALIRSQMLLEAAVAATPEPVITVFATPGGTLSAQIRYADAATNAAAVATLNVSG